VIWTRTARLHRDVFGVTVLRPTLHPEVTMTFTLIPSSVEVNRLAAGFPRPPVVSVR